MVELILLGNKTVANPIITAVHKHNQSFHPQSAGECIHNSFQKAACHSQNYGQPNTNNNVPYSSHYVIYNPKLIYSTNGWNGGCFNEKGQKYSSYAVAMSYLIRVCVRLCFCFDIIYLFLTYNNLHYYPHAQASRVM